MESENKKITIDDLARMVQKGFSGMKEDFNITIKNSSLSEEEKRELLYQCFDI
jgi:hypothetical protein